MMTASIHGRLTTVKPLKTKTGKSMTVGQMVVNLPVAQTEETEGQWFNVLAFGDAAEELARVAPKTNVSLMGRVQFSRYEKDGEERTVLQIIADSVLTVRSARPKGRSKRTQEGNRTSASPGWKPTGDFQDPDDPFNDELPF